MKDSKTIWVDWEGWPRRGAGWALVMLAGLWVAGCVTEPKQSLEGDSCTKSADCAGELRCQLLSCTDVTRSVSTSSPIVTRPLPGDRVPRLR